jgi:hypothetical protein
MRLTNPTESPKNEFPSGLRPAYTCVHVLTPETPPAFALGLLHSSGRGDADGMVPQNKGNVGTDAAVRNTPSHTECGGVSVSLLPRTLVDCAFEEYHKGSQSLMLSKFPEYEAEEVLNDLQCLLQAQHHMALLSQEELEPDLAKIANIHECECLSMSERVREQERVCLPCECGTRPAKVVQ